MANRAVVKLFACCDIPFHIVDNPFFIDLLCTLCPGYNPPCRQTLSENMLNLKIFHIITEVNLKLSGKEFLTLGLKI